LAGGETDIRREHWIVTLAVSLASIVISATAVVSVAAHPKLAEAEETIGSWNRTCSYRLERAAEPHKVRAQTAGIVRDRIQQKLALGSE
jgi:hypothetical protein